VPVTLIALALIIAAGFVIRQIVQRSGAIKSENARTLYGVSLGLEARRRFEGVHVTWDRNSAYVRTALSGVLKISDGTTVTELPLNEAQVRYGQYYLTPSSDSVQIALNVLSNENQHLEEAAVLTVELSDRNQPLTASPASERAEIAAASQRSIPDVAMRSRRGAQADSSGQQLEAGRAARSRRAATDQRALAGAANLTTASPNVRPDPEQLRLSLPAPSLSAVRTLHPIPVQDTPILPSPAPPTETRAEATAPDTSRTPSNVRDSTPPSQSETQKPLSAAPNQAPVRPATLSNGIPGVLSAYVPASPISKSTIVLPDVLKASLRSRPQEVEVVAQVDIFGRVKSIRAKTVLSGLQDNLLNAARPALMGWRFRPAMLGEKPVESEVMLRLKFGGSGR